jgi:hypothetical protein
MNIQEIDKAILKSTIREILIEDSSIFKNIIREILIENKVIGEDAESKRRQQIEALIDADFDKYDDVFKALA